MVARVCLINHTIGSYADNAIQDPGFLIDRALTESFSDLNLEYLLQLVGIPIAIIIGGHGCKVITMNYKVMLCRARRDETSKGWKYHL